MKQKERNLIKRFMAVILAAIMIFGDVSAGMLAEIDLTMPDWLKSPFGTEVRAASISNLTFTLIKNDTEYEVSGCVESASGELDISATYNGKPVTSIGDRAFYYCTGLTSVTIPDSVTSIGGSAFSYCFSLTSVTIPDSVTSIEDRAFYYCKGLTSVTIPDSVTSIGDYAFELCGKLESICVNSENTQYSSDSGVLFNKNKTKLIQYPAGKTEPSYTIPDSVMSIGERAFYYCDKLTSVIIPDSVTKIGEEVFCGCSNVTSVIIGNSVERIEDNAFAECYSLTSVTIGNSVTSIGIQAFSCCESLISVTIPDSVTSIGYWAFEECYSLESIYVSGGNIKYSSDNYGVLFNKDKTKLICYPSGKKETSYIIPDTVTSIEDRSFIHCDNLTSVTIPDSVKSIGNFFFYYCKNLKSATIPDSVTSIGNRVFYSCNKLTSVTIGNSVETIDIRSFSYCKELKSVIIKNHEMNIGEDVFSDCHSDLKIYKIPKDKGTVIDIESKLVYGVSEGISNIRDYISVEKYLVEHVETEYGFGTGTQIKIKDKYGNVFETFTLVIFGDLNGDGVVDAFDQTDITAATNFQTIYDFGSAKEFAGDVNGDGVVDAFDLSIITSAVNFEQIINQSPAR